MSVRVPAGRWAREAGEAPQKKVPRPQPVQVPSNKPTDVGRCRRRDAPRSPKRRPAFMLCATHVTVEAMLRLRLIGIPVEGSGLGGLDALRSTVQMPKGVPVACMGIGKSGALNAALLAIQILALSDPDLARKLNDYRSQMAENVEAASKKIQEKL